MTPPVPSFDLPPKARPTQHMWRLTSFPGLLTDLPRGELTLLRLTGRDPSREWWETVGSLVEEVLNDGSPAALVRVDGAMAEDLRTFVDWNEGSGLLTVIDDSDLHVRPWHQHLRPHGYACNIPTLHNVQMALTEGTEQHETTLLVLEQVQRARPWRAEGQPTYPRAKEIAPGLIDQERAAQIHGFARMRRHAATLAVWHHQNVDRPEAVEALMDDARFIIEHAVDPDDRGYIRAFVRVDLVEELEDSRATSPAGRQYR